MYNGMLLVRIIVVLVWLMPGVMAYGVEFYEAEAPRRQTLNENYVYNIDVDESVDQGLDLSQIKQVYRAQQGDLYLAEQKNKEELTKVQQERDSKRQKFIQKNESGTEVIKTVDTKISKKEVKKTWIDDWLPENNIKPMDLVGAYIAFKFRPIIISPTTISAKETTGYTDNYHTTQLFSGTAKYHISPSFLISVGNDRFKWWRWELELGYTMMLARNTGNLETDSAIAGYTFFLDKKDLSAHLLTFVFNGFLQRAFYDQRLVGFVGLGLGVGHAWSMGSTLSSDFVFPIVTGQLGVSFMVKKAKVNIAYALTYTRIALPNKYSFDRVNSFGVDGSNKAIQSGSLKFSAFLLNSLSIEYMFYTA